MNFTELGIKSDSTVKDAAKKGKLRSINNDSMNTRGLKPDNINICQKVVSVGAMCFRPTKVDLAIGELSKSNSKLNWTPKYDMATLVKEIVLLI